MTEAILPSAHTVATELAALGVVADPSEVHGALCGFLAGGGRPQRDWLAQLALEAEHAPAPGGVLETLREVSGRRLQDPDFGFELLLPEEPVTLEVRADAVLAWCRGFLGGFGLAGPALDLLSEDAREALEDLGRIAASRLSYEDAEGDETALEEVVEFVRVAVLLLHGDCVLGPQHRRSLH
ncbi:UPF0149 family protein [Coralloluteibacterium stylophorae]|uniref:UPF0149 family protein n=3 Tax=Coralloluteibacterium stylophorae TaxID=1776034 RepID=A0AAP2FZQ8_9GAMM|nr:UPF0149 family protein [Coralloluteibacterium stylophorae]